METSFATLAEVDSLRLKMFFDTWIFMGTIIEIVIFAVFAMILTAHGCNLKDILEAKNTGGANEKSQNK